MVPLAALPPTTLLTYQVTAVLLEFCTVAVINCVAPPKSVIAGGDSETLTTGAGGFTVTEVEAVLLVSAAERAVTVKIVVAARPAGAAYSPADEMVPTLELPPATPFTSQVTELLPAF
jgi:hypothetical protein